MIFALLILNNAAHYLLCNPVKFKQFAINFVY